MIEWKFRLAIWKVGVEGENAKDVLADANKATATADVNNNFIVECRVFLNKMRKSEDYQVQFCNVVVVDKTNNTTVFLFGFSIFTTKKYIKIFNQQPTKATSRCVTYHSTWVMRHMF
jgi:hypothetical protein